MLGIEGPMSFLEAWLLVPSVPAIVVFSVSTSSVGKIGCLMIIFRPDESNNSVISRVVKF